MLFVYGMLVVIGADWSAQVFHPHTAKQLWGWPLDVVFPAKAVDAIAADEDDSRAGGRS